VRGPALADVARHDPFNGGPSSDPQAAGLVAFLDVLILTGGQGGDELLAGTGSVQSHSCSPARVSSCQALGPRPRPGPYDDPTDLGHQLGGAFPNRDGIIGSVESNVRRVDRDHTPVGAITSPSAL
jgi:hypothetical protein